MTNTFMVSAARSKREQQKLERTGEGAGDSLRVMSIRVPESLHRKAQLHRIETGENMTQLICRLLAEELGD